MATRTREPEDPVQAGQPGRKARAASKDRDESKIRPARVSLSPEETRARVKAFAAEREEAFVAAVREDEG